ncbi:branched-chain amino acid ABC transporter permease [Pseudonocardia nematodicida]|uniref:Branched-chain amino acid ABC transporter permease n=1 Tax=Pseudonocardia nematodicida TaxID=1206997 RepID=A0ABV1KDY9_9PSEU
MVAPELRNSTVHLITEISIWACVAVSLHLVVGYAGQLSLASGAFLALGAYIGARATGFWGWPGLLTIAVAAVVAALLALLIALVIFRARGLYFALLTAGISLVAHGVIVNWSSVTGGAGGMSTGGPLADGGLPGALTLGPVAIESADDYLVAAVGFLAVLVLGLSVLMRRRVGESWKAIREDDVLAASVGVDVVRQKQAVFVLSSVLITLSGVLYAHWIGFVSPESFTFAHAAFEPIAMIMIGGLGTVAGPIVGAAVVAGLPEMLRDAEHYSVLVYGVLLLAVVMVAPRGIVGLVTTGLAAVRRRLRRGENS